MKQQAMRDNVTSIEERAKALDEVRKSRIIGSQDVSIEKYLHASDITHKVRPATEWLDEIAESYASPQEKVVIGLPWQKTQSFAFRPGEVTLYAGANGGGKSLITGQIVLGLIKQGERTCVASFEMKPARSLTRMLRQFSGEDINAPRFSDPAKYIKRLTDRFDEFSKTKLWFYDQQGTVTAQQVIAASRYAALECGVKHVFIDSLMKCVQAEDDYNAQKIFVDELTALARDHSIHIHLVHHIRKQGNDDQMPTKNDVKGSGAISDLCDNVMLVWRNKKKEHQIQAGKDVDPAQPDAMLMCEKQRNGEAEDWFSLYYHRESQQFLEAHDGMPMAFDDKGRF